MTNQIEMAKQLAALQRQLAEHRLRSLMVREISHHPRIEPLVIEIKMALASGSNVSWPHINDTLDEAEALADRIIGMNM